jgi:hypothetical protein
MPVLLCNDTPMKDTDRKYIRADATVPSDVVAIDTQLEERRTHSIAARHSGYFEP